MGRYPMKPLVVGLTGGIGSGKTTVSNLFASVGIKIIDADVIAREVVEPGTEALQQIAEHFGASILTPEGALNRQALRQRIFSNQTEKAWLDQLLHPRIREVIQHQLDEAQGPYCILSAPLLLENNLHALTDRVLVVDVSEETQIKRTTSRDGVSDAQIKAIIAAQIDRQSRLQAADDIIHNDGSLASVKHQVEKLDACYRKLALTNSTTN